MVFHWCGSTMSTTMILNFETPQCLFSFYKNLVRCGSTDTRPIVYWVRNSFGARSCEVRRPLNLARRELHIPESLHISCCRACIKCRATGPLASPPAMALVGVGWRWFTTWLEHANLLICTITSKKVYVFIHIVTRQIVTFVKDKYEIN